MERNKKTDDENKEMFEILSLMRELRAEMCEILSLMSKLRAEYGDGDGDNNITQHPPHSH